MLQAALLVLEHQENRQLLHPQLCWHHTGGACWGCGCCLFDSPEKQYWGSAESSVSLLNDFEIVKTKNWQHVPIEDIFATYTLHILDKCIPWSCIVLTMTQMSGKRQPLKLHGIASCPTRNLSLSQQNGSIDLLQHLDNHPKR